MPFIATFNANRFLRCKFSATYPGDMSKASLIEAAQSETVGYLPQMALEKNPPRSYNERTPAGNLLDPEHMDFEPDPVTPNAVGKPPGSVRVPVDTLYVEINQNWKNNISDRYPVKVWF